MAGMDAKQWLEQWVVDNLDSPEYVDTKTEMLEEAQICAVDAERAQLSAEDLKAAAGGDLQKYLMERQNAITDEDVAED